MDYFLQPQGCYCCSHCHTVCTFYTRDEILDGLRSKWLLFLGDGSTQGLVQTLTTHLDPGHTRPLDFGSWYNVSETEAGRFG